jgi:regulator of cell morphogenesis and NO signaling
VSDLQNIYSEKKTALDFDALTLHELSDYIVKTHHAYLKREMPQIVCYLQKVVSKHGNAHPEMVEIARLFNVLHAEMSAHLQKEEDLIFPAICQLESNQVQPASCTMQQAFALPFVDLENEHETAGNIMTEINKLTHNYTLPPDSCTTFTLLYASLKGFELDLHQHVHLENGLLFPKALKLDKERRMTTHN